MKITLLFLFGHKLRFTLFLGNKTGNDGLKMSLGSTVAGHLCDSPLINLC